MSRPGSPLAKWLQRLETFSVHDIELGLERVSAVLRRLDLARPGFVIHVGGTNGKGSSVAMLQALLQTDGAVGTYTSPHIHRFNERISVNGEPVSDEQIVDAFERIEAVRGDTPLTYFEYGTLAALVVFSRLGIERMVLEVGMGGRLDAVNAVQPDAALISNVSLDHCDWLGDDIETIAAEKAGIMRAGKPVVFGSEPVPAAIHAAAATLGADLRLLQRDYDYTAGPQHWSWQGRQLALESLTLPALPGRFQVGNAAAVLALLEAAGQQALLSADTVNAAMASLSLPGRLQRIDTDRQYLLDVAHNPAAAAVLAETLAAMPAVDCTVAIIAMLEDKDCDAVIEALDSQVDLWVAVAADNPRALAAEELARRIANHSNAGCLIAPSLDAALDYARARSSSGDRVLITGSFYLVGPALEKLYTPTATGG